MRVVIGAAVIIAATWMVFFAVLFAMRPKHVPLLELRRTVPDTVRLLRDLSRDESLPRGVRRRIRLLLAYLAMPIDLVPDFVPVIGYADDVIVVALVLRSVVRLAGPSAVERHWAGSAHGLTLVKRVCGL